MGLIKKIIRRLKKIYWVVLKRDRVHYARLMGVRIGKGAQILTDPEECFGSEPWLIKIGDHVDITTGVEFLNHEGGMWCVREYFKEYKDMDCFAPIIVGDNVMIGRHSLIMPGVTIGNNVIIGGYSVVTKDIPDNAIVVGSPAKQISDIDTFISGLSEKNLVETKKMSNEQKRNYLLKKYPEWFE